MNYRVKLVEDFIHDNAHRRISIDEIARSVNLSSSRLRSLFRAQTGVPLSQYVKAVRLESAKGLLETSFFSVKEIVVKVGINDVSHFVRDFEKVYGHTPTRYRLRFIDPSLDN